MSSESDHVISESERQRAWDYARGYYPDDSFTRDLEMVERYVPDVAVGYLMFRRAAYASGPNAALDEKTKELLLVAMAIGARKVNPPPHGHVRLAIDAGASLQEIAEIVALSLVYCGALTFHEAGRHVLRYAEEYVREREAKT